MSQIILVGLGPGDPGRLTRDAWSILSSATEIFTTAAQHPVLSHLPSSAQIVGLADVTPWPTSPDILAAAVQNILDLAIQRDVIIAVPGHPLVDEPFARRLLDEARTARAAVQIIPGVSLLEAAWEVILPGSPSPVLQVIDAHAFAAAYPPLGAPGFSPFAGTARGLDPTVPAALQNVREPAALTSSLARLYPPDHTAVIVSFVGDQVRTQSTTVVELQQQAVDGWACLLYLPPVDRLADLGGFDTLGYIVARLRAPDGCPWDREQTHDSMKKHLIEESYEAITALESANWKSFAGELGDVLLQVLMHAQLGREEGRFDIEDVLRAVNEKLIRRHPHVFGDVRVSSSAEVLRNWERIKRGEGGDAPTTLGNIPPSLPALMRADALQGRAARYGWEPPGPEHLQAAVARLTSDRGDQRGEIGALLFSVVAVARRLGVDPEEALRRETVAFIERVESVLAALQGDPAFESLPEDERRRRVAAAFRSSPPESGRS
jgi:tetrapyrrole methylase family protein/MazG family protein